MHQKLYQPLDKILSCHLFHQIVSIWKFLLSALHSGLTMLPMYFTYEDCQLLLCSQPLCLISSVLKPTNWSRCYGDIDRDVMEGPREPGYWRVRSLLRGETEAWTQWHRQGQYCRKCLSEHFGSWDARQDFRYPTPESCYLSGKIKPRKAEMLKHWYFLL